MRAREQREQMTREGLGTQFTGLSLFLFLAFFCAPMQVTAETPFRA